MQNNIKCQDRKQKNRNAEYIKIGRQKVEKQKCRIYKNGKTENRKTEMQNI